MQEALHTYHLSGSAEASDGGEIYVIFLLLLLLLLGDICADRDQL